MADVSSAIRSRLTSHTGTSALVGTRVWYLYLPKDPTLPAVTVQQISGARTSAMGADPGPINGRVQVDAWASSRAGAKALAEQVRDALQRFTGTSDGTLVEAMFLESETEEWEDQGNMWRIRHDYMTWWRE